MKRSVVDKIRREIEYTKKVLATSLEHDLILVHSTYRDNTDEHPYSRYKFDTGNINHISLYSYNRQTLEISEYEEYSLQFPTILDIIIDEYRSSSTLSNKGSLDVNIGIGKMIAEGELQPVGIVKIEKGQAVAFDKMTSVFGRSEDTKEMFESLVRSDVLRRRECFLDGKVKYLWFNMNRTRFHKLFYPASVGDEIQHSRRIITEIYDIKGWEHKTNHTQRTRSGKEIHSTIHSAYIIQP